MHFKNGIGYLATIEPLTLYSTIPTFNDPGTKPFENIVGKGENAGNQFSTLPQTNVTFILSSANALNLDWPKILSLVKS